MGTHGGRRRVVAVSFYDGVNHLPTVEQPDIGLALPTADRTSRRASQACLSTHADVGRRRGDAGPGGSR